jgi:predicted MFS family arabinose efflux permease
MARFGWLAPFPFLAVMGALAAVLLFWLLPGDPSPEKDRPSFWQNFRGVFTYRPAVVGLSMGLLINAGNEVVNLVFGVWMEDTHGLQIAALGAASAIIGVSELGGEALVGGLTDRMGKSRAVATGLVLNSLAAVALPLLGRNVTGALVGLFLFYITFEFTLVSTIPIMTEIMPHARATFMAIFVAGLSLGRALGDLVAVPLYNQGFLVNGLVAASLNLLTLLALSRLRHKVASLQSETSR